MAKKSTLDAKLDAGMQSWEAQITPNLQTEAEEPQPQDKSDRVKRKTFLVTQTLIDRINQTAASHGVGQSELVRHLLTWSLDQIDEGSHKIPLGTPQYTIER
jgi:hypothetical protein